MVNSTHVISIHIIDDDSLLNIFYLFRPFFLGEDEDDYRSLDGGHEPWVQGRWWYRLAHVCQRWRNLILGSSSYLGLSLVCTNGTPVANMLEHSPPLPLTIDYRSEDGITAQDKEGIYSALEQRDRVRHLRLSFPVQNLRKLVLAIDEEFPILEYLIVGPTMEDGTDLKLSETFQAPNLHHLKLGGFACPIRPRLHPTATGLVTLYLIINHPSAYFQPNVLLQWISFMPHLETLAILFTFPVPNRDVKRQITHTPNTAHITLPSLRLFWFRGVSAYLEAVICRLTTPLLEDLQIQFFEELTLSVPCLPQFMNTTENLRFDRATLDFTDEQIKLVMYSRGAKMRFFVVSVDCWHLDWQVSSVAQICNLLSQVFSPLEHLALRHKVHVRSSEDHEDVDRIEWRNLLWSFNNVRTLSVEDGLVEDLSRCLRLEDGELPLELLPELHKLTYFGSRDAGGVFTSFINSRRDAGRPVALLMPEHRPTRVSFYLRCILIILTRTRTLAAKTQRRIETCEFQFHAVSQNFPDSASCET